jgi:lysozyme family protein
MADINKLIPFIMHWEGRFANDPADRGGPTNKGVTLKAWKVYGYDKDLDGDIDVNDLKMISDADVIRMVLKPHYWNLWQADRINNQSIANILVDWVWHSGIKGITIPQEILKVKPDGIVGEKTLEAVNRFPDQKMLFNMLKLRRIKWVKSICEENSPQETFLKGWINRINALKFSLTVLFLLLSLNLGGCKPTGKMHDDREEITLKSKSSETDTLHTILTSTVQSSSAFSGSMEEEEILTETTSYQGESASSELALTPAASVKTVTHRRLIRKKENSAQTDIALIHKAGKIESTKTAGKQLELKVNEPVRESKGKFKKFPFGYLSMGSFAGSIFLFYLYWYYSRRRS